MKTSDLQRATEDFEYSYPLSPMQQGMLFHAVLHPGSGVDTQQLIFKLREALDVAALKNAWKQVVARHPVLRTTFHWEDLPEPRQTVHAPSEVPWQQHDWREVAAADRENRLADLLIADRRLGFNLAQTVPMRFMLLRYGKFEWRLIWTYHHILLDGRSRALLIREVFTFYDAFGGNKQIDLPVPRPYRDYIAWLEAQNFANAEAYWRKILKGFSASTPLPISDPINRVEIEIPEREHQAALSLATTSALRALAESNTLTLNTLVQGAWAVLLNRYSGESDVVFGVIRSLRRNAVQGADGMIGLFINTLPLRVLVKPEMPLLPWLKEIRLQWMAMRDYEHTPLASVQAWSDMPSGHSVFQSTVMFENYHFASELQKEGGPWTNRQVDHVFRTNSLIDLAAYDGEQLHLQLNFDPKGLSDESARRILTQLLMLLESMAIGPSQRLGDLQLLDSRERDTILRIWNDTGRAVVPVTLASLFAAQVTRAPEKPALVCGDRSFSYAALDADTDRLADHLRRLGVGPEIVVGLCAERSAEMVIGLLAIIKAGGVYLPLDPSYPSERLQFMVRDAGAAVVVVQSTLLDHLSMGIPGDRFDDVPDGRTILRLDRDWHAIVHRPLTAPARDLDPHNAAYVIYTSGSTGMPKGVVVEHASLVNKVVTLGQDLRIGPGFQMALLSSPAVDPSLEQVLVPLIHGATLVVVGDAVRDSPDQFWNKLAQSKVNVLDCTPSWLETTLDYLPEHQTLDYLVLGGETFTTQLQKKISGRLKNTSVTNLYGPTECTIDATGYIVEGDEVGTHVPIGRPLANYRTYVLDAALELLPSGATGELYIAGAGLARGYLRRSGLTAERFVADPFGPPGSRMYRTGDLARWRDDGVLEFLGRADKQIKLRGFRIELEEVEQALVQHPCVRQAAAAIREAPGGNGTLVAYVVASVGHVVDVAELVAQLQRHLPSHMVPSSFVLLKKLPLTPNGKLDRRALPALDRDIPESFVTPRSPTEELLAGIWRDVLHVTRIGVRDNFFELGGHSLLVVRLIYEINRAFGVSLSVPDVFDNATVEQLAKRIRDQYGKAAQRSAVIHLKAGRNGPPVYFVYAGPNEFKLARLMGENAVFGIEITWPLKWRRAVAADRRSEFPSMEELVALYVSALRTHIGGSSCILAGFSFAGLMAFEAAHQFQRQGGKVETVILFDTWAKRRNRFSREMRELKTRNTFWQAGQSFFKRAMNWVFRRTTFVVQEIWLFLKRERRSKLLSVPDDQGPFIEWAILERLYDRISESYRPSRLAGRGILVRADPVGAAASYDEDRGWKNLFADGLKIVSIVGDHFSPVRQDNVRLAQEFEELLRQRGP